MNTLKIFFAFDPKDTEEIRLAKFSVFLVAGSCTLAGCIWTAMYYVVFGWGLTTLLPALFVIIVGGALVISHLSKNHLYAIYAQIICIIYLPAFIQWNIGGAFDAGFVLVWGFLGPICALMFFSIRQSVFWFSLYLLNLAVTVILNDFFASQGQAISESTKLFFFMMNLGVASMVVFVFSGYYVNAAVSEQKKANQLFQANLQQEIALRQNEKLATLGKLSAGVAHELNNPAAAARSGTEQLRESMTQLEQAQFKLGLANLSAVQIVTLESYTNLIAQRAKEPLDLSPLARSDQEAEIQSWLDERGVENAWELAPMLVNIGFRLPELATLAENFVSQEFPVVLTLFGNIYTTRSLLEEIGQGTSRITEIVKALKSYSYLDQAPTQAVNIHEGLDNTLVMLHSKLKAGVQVRRDYASDLPRIEAFGGELNQVWTNLIDNAVSAMNGQGEIILRTYRQVDWVVVEIKDTGPGIPPEIQAKIFDPFFTTKAPGDGTGLGLNISHNIIVQRHKGQITVHSKPGETCFEIKLPLKLTVSHIKS